MPTLPHNQRAIDGLNPIAGKRTSYTSTVVDGLVLEVLASGARSWCSATLFTYRTHVAG